MDTPAQPSLLLVRIDFPPADAAALGGIVRLDQDFGTFWIISLLHEQVTFNRVLDCLSLLLLDEQRRILPHILFPYNPPEATLTRDGRFLDYMGKELGRAYMAILQHMRLRLRTEYSEFIDDLTKAFTPDPPERMVPLKNGHPLFNPSVPIVDAGVIPASLLSTVL